METPSTPQAVLHVSDTQRASEAMDPDVSSIVELVRAQIQERAASGKYEPALNRHFENAKETMLIEVIDRLQEQLEGGLI